MKNHRASTVLMLSLICVLLAGVSVYGAGSGKEQASLLSPYFSENTTSHTDSAYIIDNIIFNPHSEGSLWATTKSGAILSIDPATSDYKFVVEPAAGGFDYNSIYALATSRPENPAVRAVGGHGTIYALSNGKGIIKSTNNGLSWELLENAEVKYAHSIVVHPLDANLVYSAHSAGVYENNARVMRTMDGGETWSVVFEQPGEQTTIAIDPRDENIVYVGLAAKSEDGGGAVFKSTDQGNTWSRLNDQFNMLTIWGQDQLVVDPVDSDTVYAGTWLAGTWKTNDAGASWEKLDGAPLSVISICVDKHDNDTVYLGDRSSPTVWKSTDGGNIWKVVGDFRSDGALLVMRVVSDGDTVYAATFHPNLRMGRLYKSTNGGESWDDITNGLGKGVLDIAIDPQNPDTLYVMTNINFAYKSINGGDSWEQIDSFPDAGPYDIEVNPENTSEVFAAVRGGSLPSWFTRISGDFPAGIVFKDGAGVYKSEDSGKTWNHLIKTTGSCRAVRLHPHDPNVIFTVDIFDGLLITTDGGLSWRKLSVGKTPMVLTSIAVAGERIYVGTQGCGIYSGDIDLNDWSITWCEDRCNKPIPDVFNMMIHVDIENQDKIFVSSYPGGMFYSGDGGLSWSDRNAITPSIIVDDPLRQGYYTFSVYPAETSQMWLGTWGKGAWVSYDSHVLNIPSGLYNKQINMIMAIDAPIEMDEYMLETFGGASLVAKKIFAATEEGIFISIDGGATWKDFSQGLEGLQVRNLARTPSGEMYCGTLGYGIFRYDMLMERWLQVDVKIQPDPPQNEICLSFHPEDQGVLYLATNSGGIYKSQNSGRTWQEINTGFPNSQARFILSNPKYTDQVIVAGENGIYLSPNGGNTWEAAQHDWINGTDIKQIIASPIESSTLYALGLFRPLNTNSLLNNSIVLLKSYDSGNSWSLQELDLPGSGSAVMAIHPSNIETVFIGTSNGLFSSTDSGKSWVRSEGDIWENATIESIAIDSVNADTLYVSVSRFITNNHGGFDVTGDIIKSMDGGNSWNTSSMGLNTTQAFGTVVVNSLDPDIVYLLTREDGIYISVNQGDDWNLLPIKTPYQPEDPANHEPTPQPTTTIPATTPSPQNPSSNGNFAIWILVISGALVITGIIFIVLKTAKSKY
ncbi:MAG: hypothetical protein PHQ10_03750 [Dehalococcoidales bacterium]|nr:hypothetical protein [Dehalococcoidales bacterium]